LVYFVVKEKIDAIENVLWIYGRWKYCWCMLLYCNNVMHYRVSV